MIFSNIKKSYLFLLLLCLFSFFSFSQEVLTELNTSWQTVLSGKVISKPAVTSYGFCVVTDARNIAAISNNGKVLWDKFIIQDRDSRLFSLSADFIAVLSGNGRNLSVLNPSGMIIWQKQLSFEGFDVFSGRDGRFFIRGKNNLQCFAINGISKWLINTSELNLEIPFLEFSNGNLFFVHQNQIENNGIVVSPFGEILNTFCCKNEIINAFYNNKGIYFCFRDSIEYYDLNKSSYPVKKYSVSIDNKILNYSKNDIILFDKVKNETIYLKAENNSTKVYSVPEFAKNGTVTLSFIYEISDFNPAEIRLYDFNYDGLFIAANNKVRFYTKTGAEIFNSNFKHQQNNYFVFTTDNHFILCKNDWTLYSYKLFQNSYNQDFKLRDNYHNFFTLNGFYTDKTIDDDIASDELLEQLKLGNYGAKEIHYASGAYNILKKYEDSISTSDFGTGIDYSLFEIETKKFEKVINQISLYGTYDFAEFSSSVIRRCHNKTIMILYLQQVSSFGYDPNGTILNSIQYISSRINPKNEEVICALCDAIYSLCYFMGRPVFNTKGREILATFVSANTTDKIRAHTRATMYKIKQLDL